MKISILNFHFMCPITGSIKTKFSIYFCLHKYYILKAVSVKPEFINIRTTAKRAVNIRVPAKRAVNIIVPAKRFDNIRVIAKTAVNIRINFLYISAYISTIS